MKGEKALVVKGLHKGAEGLVMYEDKKALAIYAPNWPWAWYDFVYGFKADVKIVEKGEGP